jgi:membrane protease YdiL (CAAX protease family)
MDKPQQTKLDLRGIGWFLAIAYGIAWLLVVPMWISGQGANSPWALLITGMNFAPTIATLIVVRWISALPHIRQTTGLRLGVRGSRWGLYWLCGWLGFIAFSVAAPFVGSLFGLLPMDLTHFSGYREALESSPVGQHLPSLAPIRTLALVVLLTLPLQALLLTPFTFGEEWGWRGYLLPQLLPLGQWPALLMSGAIWGFWHAPLILLGFNYPEHPVFGVFLMVIFSTIVGTLLGWTRLATGSVWPAVLGHAGLNSSQVLGGVFVLTQAGAKYDTAQVFISGWTGWILPLLFIGLLVLTRRLPVRGVPSSPNPGPVPVAASEPNIRIRP